MMEFLHHIEGLTPLPWDRVASRLGAEDLSLAEAATLLTPGASSHLEMLAQAAHQLTARRFGRTIKLYAPIYLSNECVNGCLYCGFRAEGAIARRTLTTAEALAEARAVTAAGHRHLLLVSGEHPTAMPLACLEEIARALRPLAAGLAVEVAPQDEAGYRRLAAAGVDGVTLYQETYDEAAYRCFHPSGPKQAFGSRIAAIDAAGRSGMRFLGIGALLGLSEWRREALALIAHARALMRTHWRSAITVSVPRLRDCAARFTPPHPVSDREFAQIICALRLALPDAGIALSTREPAKLRDALLPLGVTQMSAGSVTVPGGHASGATAGEQFHLEDGRRPADVAAMLTRAGYDPVWKDWDKHLHGSGVTGDQ
jgi:2-iminoacetate synthase